MEFIREIRAEFHFVLSRRSKGKGGRERSTREGEGEGRKGCEQPAAKRGKRVTILEGTRRRGEVKRKGSITHISIHSATLARAAVSPLLAFHPFCPRTLSNHSEREQPTEQAVPRLLNVIKSSLPPSIPSPNRLDSSPPPPLFFRPVQISRPSLRLDRESRSFASTRPRFIGKPAFAPLQARPFFTLVRLSPQIYSPIFEQGSGLRGRKAASCRVRLDPFNFSFIAGRISRVPSQPESIVPFGEERSKSSIIRFTLKIFL